MDAVVTIKSNALGEVIVFVDGINSTVKLNDKGVGTLNLSSLDYGDHSVVAVYDGDNKFLGSNITSSISVSKYDSFTIVTVGDIKVGQNATITVTVPTD